MTETHDMDDTIGARARRRREELKLTASQVSKLSGISPGMLSDLENERSYRTTKINRLADALGLSVDWLERKEGPRLATGGRRASDAPPRYAIHGDPSEEALRVAMAWEKLDSPVRAQIRVMIETLVEQQVREKRGKKKKGADMRDAPN